MIRRGPSLRQGALLSEDPADAPQQTLARRLMRRLLLEASVSAAPARTRPRRPSKSCDTLAGACRRSISSSAAWTAL